MRTSLDFFYFHCSPAGCTFLFFVFWLRTRTYVCPLTFLFTFTAFLSSFIPEIFLNFTCPILSPFTEVWSNRNFLVIFREISASFASLRPDAGPAGLKVESLPITTAAFSLKVSHNTLDGIQLDFKTLRIYISAHVVSTSFKFNSMFVDKHGQGKGGVLENKNKRATRKIRITAGRPQCINWLQDPVDRFRVRFRV